MKKLLATSAIALALATTGGGDAKAQAIDYGSLKELFGQPVTTSANGSPQKESEVPLNMEIVTQDDIKRMGARTIPEALRFIPGVTVRQVSFGQTEVSIRGYNGPNAERLLVLVNGRQVYKDYFGLVTWGDIPVEMPEIQQIEVVKGPNTALFGFNAVSGVINIITYNPLYEDVGELQVRAGTQSMTEASAVKTFKFGDRVATRLSAGGYDAEEFDDFDTHLSDLNAANPDPTARNAAFGNSRRSVAVDTWVQLTDNWQGQVELTHSTHQRKALQVTRTGSGEEYDTMSARARVLGDTDWGLIEADYYHNEVRADAFFFNNPNPATSFFQADNRLDVFKLNNTFKVGTAHTFRVGGEYRNTTHIFEPLDNSSDLMGETFGISGLWDWAVNDKLSTSAAVRFDHFSLEKDAGLAAFNLDGLGNPIFTEDDLDGQSREEIGFNLGAVYELSDKDTVRATISRGIDLPSMTEFAAQFIGSGDDGNLGFDATGITAPGALADNEIFIGDPDTDSSIVHNFEVGYDRQLENIDGMMRLAAFYQHNKDMQAFGAGYDPAGALAGIVNRAGNIGDSEAYGAEISFEGKFRDNWDWFVNYSYIEIEDDLNNFGLNSSAPTKFSSSAFFEDSVRNHRVNAHLGYTGERWRADAFAQYLNSNEQLFYGPSDSATNLSVRETNDFVWINANIAYDLTDNLTWSVSGANLAGPSPSVPEGDVERQVWTTLSIDF